MEIPEDRAVVSEDTSEHKYIASRESDVFHRRSCRWAEKIAERNRVYFRSYKEAVKSGRRACKLCKPEDDSP